MRIPNLRRTTLALALLAPPGLLSADDAAPPTAAPGQVIGAKTNHHPDWFKESFLDIAEDVAEAADADKHVILFFEMNGCPYCYKMATENFDGAPYEDWLRERFDVIALNVDGDREVALDAATTLPEKALADRLGVRFTPTVVFLDQDNRPVARVSGYRNVDDFKRVLDYVAGQTYRAQTLADYLATRAGGAWTFREHPLMRPASAGMDLSALADRPLALLFEDAACTACAALYDGHLADPEVQKALRALTVVRLDAAADTALTGPDGRATTSRQLAADLGIEYRPTLVLFDEGREIARIESMLYRYHFTGVLEYVGQRHYRRYPDDPFDYIDAKTAALIAAGKDVAIADD